MKEKQLKYEKIVRNMTLEEKASLMSGKNFWETVNIDRLGIPSITLADGPHGIRRQAGNADHLGLNPSLRATCYPTASAMANSWDPKLGEEVGHHLGIEARSQGVHILLGPGLNMKRSPLCGRNFEYFSEDPYLAGKMASAYIRGIQEEGVASCPKHFAVNSQELRRMSTNSVVDERTLREIYLTGFEIAVKEGKPKTLMSAYNMVNGVYANENEHLLKEILTEEWGFQGVVVSDWGGSNDHVAGVIAGSHLEMPSTGMDGILEITTAVNEGRLSEQVLDQRVDELLDLIFTTDRAEKEKGKNPFDKMAHHRMAEQVAENCIVLLKNEEQLLPLKQGTQVAVVGDFAKDPRYQGAGSSMVNPTRLDHTLDLIGQSGLDCLGYAQGFHRNGEPDEKLVEEAVKLAQNAEVVLVYMGLSEQKESEGMDRKEMSLPKNQIELLRAISAVNDKVVVILSAGSVVEMSWDVEAKAIVHGYLAGQAGANAILNVLTGRVCPSGRLSETYPICYEDTPAYHYYPGKERNCEYREGLYIGYRYYDTVGIPVKYPFGYGLSYTTFAYKNLRVSRERVCLEVTNTGNVDGAEVVQIYVAKPDSRVYRPKKELKGFQKIFLRAGESAKVEIPLDDKAFRYFNGKTNRWEVEAGMYTIMAGSNVQEIHLEEEIFVEGSPVPRKEETKLPSYWSGQIQDVSDEEFERLLGHPIPDGSWKHGEDLGMNDTICQMQGAKSFLARMVFRVLDAMKKKSDKSREPNLNLLFIYHMPFRGIAKMCAGVVSMDMVRALLELVNGRYVSGVSHLFTAYCKNQRLKRGARRKQSG
ncbi:glycoside hydrolase family 3 C-terminal domain-containing protein [Brotaphodocola sp.]|uniref:glycoside hydrolase family 3 C-terminal domain-containing protein n=1 Tax=Brotaphodocola sp. TaxID=3073577 RepID=UPI003D7EAE44